MKLTARAAFTSMSAAKAGLVASGLLCTAAYVAPAIARDYGNPYSYSRSYYPVSSFYGRDYYAPGRIYDRDYDSPRVDRLKAKTAEQLKKAPLPPATRGPLMVVVSIAKQSLTLYDEGVPVAHSKVSTGVADHPTPTGVFSVIQKSRWHRSNLYSDAPMPFMQRITWSGVALHAGLLPGYPASHGCIRLPEDFAIRMWRTTQMGARVIIVQNDVAPAEIAHPVLFVRSAKPAVTPPPADTPSAALNLRPAVDVAKAHTTPPALTAASAAMAKPAEEAAKETTTESIGASSDAAGQVSPTQLASADAVKTAAAAEPPSLDAPVVRDAPAAPEEPADKPALAPVTPPSVSKPIAPSYLAQGRMLRAGPVSVFISRKERKLYVRKGFEPLFDTPVVIRNQDQAIGTHVFTALAENADGVTMRWNVVSMPVGQPRVERRAELEMRVAANKKREKEVVSDAVPPPPPSSTAGSIEALDRIEMPADAVARISELMTAGASLVISDEGLGPETGQETDFVVLTKEPAPAKKADGRKRR